MTKPWFGSSNELDHKKRTEEITRRLFDLPNVKKCLEITKDQEIECGTPLFEKNGKILDGKLFTGTERKVPIRVPKSAIGLFHTHPTSILDWVSIKGKDWKIMKKLPLKCVGGVIGGNYIIRCSRSVKFTKGKGGFVSKAIVQIPFEKGAKPAKTFMRVTTMSSKDAEKYFGKRERRK